ncbi:hypothetical protein CsSME_00015448 [Camellia sinensis var. sinensis]
MGAPYIGGKIHGPSWSSTRGFEQKDIMDGKVCAEGN